MYRYALHIFKIIISLSNILNISGEGEGKLFLYGALQKLNMLTNVM